jgi:hypothetical protein
MKFIASSDGTTWGGADFAVAVTAPAPLLDGGGGSVASRYKIIGVVSRSQRFSSGTPGLLSYRMGTCITPIYIHTQNDIT